MTFFGKRILAVIPARGGSKSIKRKNLKKICGKSLIHHAADICKALPWIDLAILSTDDNEMAEEGIRTGLTVPFIRPKNLATDNASSIDMWKHAWLTSEKEIGKTFDISILLEPTSPLRTPNDIESCLDKLIQNGYKGVATVSIIPAHYRPQKTLTIDKQGKLGFFLPHKDLYSRRQNIPPYYFRNGICYAITREKLIKENKIIDESISPLLIEREIVNIDEPFDLELAELLLKKL